MRRLAFVWVSVICLQMCDLSSVPLEGMCLISAIIAQSSAMPSYFYEMVDDFDEINAKYEILRTTFATEEFKPTTTTTEAPIADEWKQRGDYRILCVDEVKADPKQIVRLMTHGDWKVENLDIKKWMLCVLNKMQIMSKEGVFRQDVALAKIHKKDRKEAEALIDYCLPKKQMAAPEIAWQYVKCHSQAKGNFSAISVF